jgi:alpha-ketoglutaric semialdehyde dehydrogenase
VEIRGHSLVAGVPAPSTETGAGFRGVNPATGTALEPEFFSATDASVDHAVQAAQVAFASFGASCGKVRGALLRAIADRLESVREPLTERAHLETALPMARLQGELARTTGQLRLFAQVAEEGSWVNARIDRALPDRTPLPRPDLRSMLRPLGPVAVFGASNFPLAFSVAGGDTASALAAGNPVIVKAHPAHPGTSEIAARAIADSILVQGLPGGIFSLLLDSGTQVGVALVEHPGIKAVGFTGSLAAGRALMDRAASRPEPIPCFTEMSSTNPVFLLPGALRERGAQIARELFGSVTLGAGQFCTKPGLVFLPQSAVPALVPSLQELTQHAVSHVLLTAGIARQFAKEVSKRTAATGMKVVASAPNAEAAQGFCAATTLLLIDTAALAAHPEWGEEVFGPTALLVAWDDRSAMLQAAQALHGHLTATLIGTPQDLEEFRDLIAVLETKVGRLIVNGYPTGVEVSHAMVHGGPYPATSDARFTSVGTQAILRFARPVCYQNFPIALLPEELHNGNPLGLLRMVDGVLTREGLE